MLKSGADPYFDFESKEKHPAHIAVLYNNDKCLKYLINYGYAVEQDLVNYVVSFSNGIQLVSLFKSIKDEIKKKSKTVNSLLISNVLNRDICNIIAQYIHTKIFYKIPDCILASRDVDKLKLFADLYINIYERDESIENNMINEWNNIDIERKIMKYFAHKEDQYGKYLYKCFLQSHYSLSKINF